MSKRRSPLGTVLSFNIPVTLTIGTLCIVLSFIAIALFAFQPRYREEIKFAITTLGAATGITSAFFVGESIKENIQSKKIDRATMYISAWTNPSFAEVRKSLKVISDLINKKPQEEWAEIVRNELRTNGPLEELDLANTL